MLEAGTLVTLCSASKKDRFLVTLEDGGKLETRLGIILHDQIMSAGYGGKVLSHNGSAFYVTKPTLEEYLRKIKRRTQIVFPKEAGYILLQLDIRPGARVLECGTGSGGMTTVFASFVGDEGRVYSYDVHTKEGKRLYRKRSISVEPVFGHIKEVLGFDRFMRRGLNTCICEWKLIYTVHNILKLWRYGFDKVRDKASEAKAIFIETGQYIQAIAL